MTLLIVYLGMAIGVSFLCSILEALFLSITPTVLTTIRRKRPRAWAILEQLRSNVDRPLAAILTLNTIAHTVGAAGVGAQAERIWGSTAVGWVWAVLTFLILVLSEIIPKTLGATYWRQLAPTAAFVIQALVWLTLPFVWMSQGITHWISAGRPTPGPSRDELSAMAEAGQMEGVISKDEASVVKNLVNSWRLPVFEDSIDRLKGFVLKADLLHAAALAEHERTVLSLVRPILILPETASVSSTCRQMLLRREHIAAAVDEYGGLAGIVTMEDILETLLGEEIIDEVDTIVDMRAWARTASEDRPGVSSEDENVGERPNDGLR